MNKTCIACGMPMNKAEDFAMKDESLEYCRFCARPDGSMQDYDEKLKSMAGFMIKNQGVDEEAAISASKSIMEKLPAWST